MKALLSSIQKLLRRPRLDSPGYCDDLGTHQQQVVEFVVQSMHTYAAFIPGGLQNLRGATLLEIGPGQDLGIALAFAGFGAQVIALDKYPCSWREELHTPVYAALRGRLCREFRGFDVKPLTEAIRHRSHNVTRVRAVESELENAKTIPDRCVDIAHSNATLEHLTDHRAALGELGRISKMHSIGFHQVDLRDHRDNFSHPLEYLTLSDSEVDRALANGEHANYFGNTPRASHYEGWFREFGFHVSTDVNERAPIGEINRVRGRLNPRFSQLADDDLGILGARFHTRKVT